jgi:hypothetical protein
MLSVGLAVQYFAEALAGSIGPLRASKENKESDADEL